MTYHIALFWPFIPKDEILANISDTLDTRWLGQGPKVDQFETEFAEKMGYDFVVFVNSGTAALELAYHLIGITEGDEVITPILNCTAGQTGLLRRQATVVFADINRSDLNISFEDVQQKITSKTKAVVAVALGGSDVDKRLFPYLQEREIPLILDAAQHHVPKLEANYICYSFQAIKHITTGDGGMLCLDNPDEHYQARTLRWFGIDRDLKRHHHFRPWEKRMMTIDITEPGYKFQPTDIDACLGLAALPFLDEVVEKRRGLVQLYKKSIRPNDNIHGLIGGGSCWLFAILCNRRDELSEFLAEFRIESHLVQLRNDIYNVFGGKRLSLPNMNWLEDKYLYLPLHTNLQPKDVLFVSKKINEFFSGG